jgi:hypothetical protein
MSQDRVVVRSVAGIEMTLVYRRRWKNVTVHPCERSLQSADALTLMRFWLMLSRWAEDVLKKTPDWRVDGYTPEMRNGEARFQKEAECGDGNGAGADEHWADADASADAGRSGGEVPQSDC